MTSTKKQKQVVMQGRLYLSQVGYAERHNCSTKSVQRRVSKGELDTAVKLIDGHKYLDPEIADKIFKLKNRGFSKARKEAQPKIEGNVENPVAAILDVKNPESIKLIPQSPEVQQMPPASFAIDVHKASKEEYESKLKRIKFEKEIGTLVERDVVEKEAEELGQTVHNSIMVIPSRIAAQLAAMTNAAECEILIETELRKALTELSA